MKPRVPANSNVLIRRSQVRILPGALRKPGNHGVGRHEAAPGSDHPVTESLVATRAMRSAAKEARRRRDHLRHSKLALREAEDRHRARRDVAFGGEREA